MSYFNDESFGLLHEEHISKTPNKAFKLQNKEKIKTKLQYRSCKTLIKRMFIKEKLRGKPQGYKYAEVSKWRELFM